MDLAQPHETNVIELRENFQYGTETKIEDKKLAELKILCKQAIYESRREIFPDVE